MNDTRNDYPNLCYLGRDANDFASYRINFVPTPVMLEVIGGLIPVVLRFVARSTNPTSPAYHLGCTNWTNSDGIAAWALVPFRRGRP